MYFGMENNISTGIKRGNSVLTQERVELHHSDFSIGKTEETLRVAHTEKPYLYVPQPWPPRTGGSRCNPRARLGDTCVEFQRRQIEPFFLRTFIPYQ